MNGDLAEFLLPAQGSPINFRNVYPAEFLSTEPQRQLPVWHLVGGLDPHEAKDLSDKSLQDGYPELLSDWIDRDGLFCLKVKLRGDDAAWDYDRLVRVGRIGRLHGVKWLSADFNCTVREPSYVIDILDRLARDEADIYEMISYVEQPFAYDLEENRIDVREVARRKPIFWTKVLMIGGS